MYKPKYEVTESDIYSFAEFIHAETKRISSRNELQFKTCPFCNGGDHNDQYTFSINLKTGLSKCMREQCGEENNFVSLCAEFDYQIQNIPEVFYAPLPQPKSKIVSKDEAVEWMLTRGIPEDITRKYEVTMSSREKALTYKVSFPIGADKILCFPFRNDKGEVEFYKFRDIEFKKGDPIHGAKEKTATGCKPIFYGMNFCKDFAKPLIVTEGQMDALSVAACGFENVVSVPTGASSFKKAHLLCSEWMHNFKEIIVFGDCEHGKITLLDDVRTCCSEYLKIRAVPMSCYCGEKDANDLLLAYGADAIKRCIEKACPPKIEALKDLASVEIVDLNKRPKIRTEIRDLDKLLGGGLFAGTLTLLTGKRGSGKSTLMSQIVASALEQGERVMVYSGELTDAHFKSWLDLQLAGKEFCAEQVNEYGETMYSVTKRAAQRISEWYKGRIWVYDNLFSADEGNATLYNVIEDAVKNYGVKLVCVDNLMAAMSMSSEDLYAQQSKFVGELKKIAMRTDVAIILLAHPRKGAVADADDVSGSADVTNKADTVIVYGKPADAGTFYSGEINIFKNRMYGRTTSSGNGIKMCYDEASRRLWQHSSADQQDKQYGWTKLLTQDDRFAIIEEKEGCEPPMLDFDFDTSDLPFDAQSPVGLPFDEGLDSLTEASADF